MKKYKYTDAKRNTMTVAGQELLSRPVMGVCSKVEMNSSMTDKNHKKRLAALKRWRRDGEVLSAAGTRELQAVVTIQANMRTWRRGESARVPGKFGNTPWTSSSKLWTAS